MKRIPRSCIAAALVLLAASAATRAQAQDVKLRPGPSITIDSKGAALAAPQGVACGAATLAVADTGNGRFAIYEIGDRLYTPKAEFAVAELTRPLQVQFDAKGNILALDAKSRRIGRIGVDGSFQGFVTIESGGGTPVIRGFWSGDDGTLYVLDIAGGRVLVTSGDGKLLRQVALPPECRAPSGVAADASGKVYVADSAGPRLYAASKDQATATPFTAVLREDMDYAGAITVDAQVRIFVLDSHGGGIVIFGPDGSFRGRQAGFGWLDGQMRWPSSLCVGDRGYLAVADRENNRIATFTFAP